MMKWLVSVLAITAATAAFWPAAGGAATVKGVVVARQHGTLLVASPSGLLQSVKGTARVGARLSGTVVVGRATHARVRGIVVRRIGTTLILSSNHHLLAIPNRFGRKLASASDTPPAPGSTTTTTTTTPTTPAPGAVVTTDVSIQQNGELEENDENQVGQSSSSTLSIQATVKAVAAGSVTLDVQGQSVTVSLPAGLTLPASLVGQTVSITVELNQDNGNNNGQGDDDQGGDHGGGGGDD